MISMRNTATSTELWRSKIFVEFCLAEDDVLSTSSPRPYYALCRRISYLPLVSVPAVHSFRSFAVDVGNKDLCFEYLALTKRVVLRSDLPLGVIYDSLVKGNKENLNSCQTFKVTIHFTKFPIAKVIRCWSIEMSQRYYLQSLKQAIYTLHGNTKIVSSTPHLPEDLWVSLNDGSLMFHIKYFSSTNNNIFSYINQIAILHFIALFESWRLNIPIQ